MAEDNNSNKAVGEEGLSIGTENSSRLESLPTISVRSLSA